MTSGRGKAVASLVRSGRLRSTIAAGATRPLAAAMTLAMTLLGRHPHLRSSLLKLMRTVPGLDRFVVEALARREHTDRRTFMAGLERRQWQLEPEPEILALWHDALQDQAEPR